MSERLDLDLQLDGLSRLARVVFSEQTVSELLELVVSVAVAAVPGVDAGSVSAITGSGRFETLHSSSETVTAIDAVQYETGGGPCIEAVTTSTEVTVEIPTGRWPEFSDAASAANLTAVWSLPFSNAGPLRGGLNLYCAGERPWEGVGPEVARPLVEQAAVVIANATALADSRRLNDDLHTALETRGLIGQAQGVLMAREGISASAAFDVLRRASQRQNRKLRVIAAEIVEPFGDRDPR